ncbi:hypothetical protein Tco_1129383, partial [Tanacetum coccineum]
MRSVLGTGSQLGHPAEPILNILKKSLQIDSKDQNICCEVCQRAKQTREPFPLSDHVSSYLGDLVHFDLRGPYKIPNDDERVDPNLNSDQRSQSDSNNSFEFGSGVNIVDFPINNSGNNVDSNDDIVATKNEE